MRARLCFLPPLQRSLELGAGWMGFIPAFAGMQGRRAVAGGVSDTLLSLQNPGGRVVFLLPCCCCSRLKGCRGCANPPENHPNELVWFVCCFRLLSQEKHSWGKMGEKTSLLHPSVICSIGKWVLMALLGFKGHAARGARHGGLHGWRVGCCGGAGGAAVPRLAPDPGGVGAYVVLTAPLLSPRSCWPLPTGPCWPRLSTWLRNPAPSEPSPSSRWPWALPWAQLSCTWPTCSSRRW